MGKMSASNTQDLVTSRLHIRAIKTLSALVIGVVTFSILPALAATPKFNTPIQFLESSKLIHIGKFDSDSFPDLLLVSGNEITYRKGSGNGNFENSVKSIINASIFSTTPTAVGDMTKVATDKAVAEKIIADAKLEAARILAEAKAKVSAALKKTTITCVKGKLTKKVTAVKPVCPAGYKKK